MNKQTIFILGLIVLFFGAAYATTKVGTVNDKNIVADEIKMNNEAENIFVEEDKTMATSADEIKVTPNTLLILKKYYEDCQHTIIDSAEIPDEMVNLTKDDVQKSYPNWVIEKFTKEEIILSKKLDSFCGEHYLVIEEDGEVLIYSLDENGERKDKEVTEIASQYLPETDKIILKNGIYVYGKEELNKIREDFES